MTKFKIYTQDPVIGYDARTRKPVRAFRKYEKPFNWYKLFFWGVMILMFMALASCSSYVPIYDPTGSTSKEFYDDLDECRFVAESQMSGFQYGYYEKQVISKCMENRGYSVLNPTK